MTSDTEEKNSSDIVPPSGSFRSTDHNPVMENVGGTDGSSVRENREKKRNGYSSLKNHQHMNKNDQHGSKVCNHPVCFVLRVMYQHV
ncbi:hypothetical protein F2Q68_00037411 [Brassica cretica]|uniref:Uncharacterized protein n=1 Tax=Brassica cretica TaxID=69181 RepID=A0A8S9H8Z9_BRACR|nr:hypothetical protein F2Q68_00037411 [Brassica cretica]